ncbi:MAG: bicyclomycin resistance protein, partial [Rubrivivax sp.]
FNRLYEAQRQLPDGPERLAAMHQARDMMVAWMPYKVHAHRFATDLVHPWVQGYHASHFRGLFWKYVDVDAQQQAQNLP